MSFRRESLIALEPKVQLRPTKLTAVFLDLSGSKKYLQVILVNSNQPMKALLDILMSLWKILAHQFHTKSKWNFRRVLQNMQNAPRDQTICSHSIFN